MTRSMEDTIMAFTEKYEGDFRRIYKAIATKERLTDEEISHYIDDIEEDSLNIISPDYPQSLKDMSCPPFVLFYEGNPDIIENDVYCLTNPYDSSKRVFFSIEPTKQGMEFFVGCEDRRDLEPLYDFFIEQHPELNFKDYAAKDGDVVCF